MWGKESLVWGSQACISLCYMRRGEGRDRGDVSSNIIMEAEQSPNTHTHSSICNPCEGEEVLRGGGGKGSAAIPTYSLALRCFSECVHSWRNLDGDDET